MTDPRTSVFTKGAPDPLPGLYSQAIIANGIVLLWKRGHGSQDEQGY